MAEPAKRHPEIEPDIRPKDIPPKLNVVQGGGESTPERAHLEKVDNDQKSDPEETSDIDAVKNGEENPEALWKTDIPEKNSTNKGPKLSKLKNVLLASKKNSPLITIAVSLVAIITGVSIATGPGLLLMNMASKLTDALHDASPALHIRSNKMIYKKFASTKNSFKTYANGKCPIACRFGSINDTMMRNFKAKGFIVNATEGTGLQKGRFIIDSMQFPDGTIVHNGAGFNEAMKSPARYSSFQKVFHSKTAYFLNSKFGQILRTKFGLNKLASLTTKYKQKATDKITSAKEKVKSSMRDVLGLPPSDQTKLKLTPRERIIASGKYKGVLDFIDGPAAKAGGKITNILQGLCAVYNIARGITYATKVGKIAAFVGFAMIFLNAADQIKAGDADPEVISALGDQLTQVDADGKSATDSLGYRTAAYNDTGPLSDDDKKYSAAIGSTTAVALLATLTFFLGKAGKEAMSIAKFACRFANNFIVGVVMSCPEQILAAIASSWSGVGPIASAAVCVGKLFATILVMSKGISYVLGEIIPALANSEIPILDGDTTGPAAGNAIYTGTAQILGGTAASYGLKAGTQDEIRQYALDTATIRQQEAAIASYDARGTPFDINNQYSFLGSIAQKLNFNPVASSSLLTSFGNLLSIVPRSFASLSNNVGAEANKKADIYGRCADTGLQQIGITGDAFCNPSYVMSDTEMNQDIDLATSYMIDNKFINEETGEAITGSEYETYIKYCVNRSDPLGETGTPIEAGDYSWAVGENCVISNEKFSYFRTYTMDKSVSDTMDEEATTIPAGNTAPPAGNVVPDNVDTGSQGWTLKSNTDYSAVQCANGTTDNNTYKHETKGYTIRLCETAIGVVSSLISQKALDIILAAKNSGINLTGAGFRTYTEQQETYANNCNSAGVCNPETAVPGTSQHERGLAIDFTGSGGNSIGASDAEYIWLTNNAKNYGFYNLPGETWHWSMNGG